MFVETAKKKLQGEDVGFNGSVKWDFEGVGQVIFDGKGGAMDIIAEDREADVTLSMTMETFGKISSKELDFMAAMGQQLIKVEGNMGVLMGLKPVMEKSNLENTIYLFIKILIVVCRVFWCNYNVHIIPAYFQYWVIYKNNTDNKNKKVNSNK